MTWIAGPTWRFLFSSSNATTTCLVARSLGGVEYWELLEEGAQWRPESTLPSGNIRDQILHGRWRVNWRRTAGLSLPTQHALQISLLPITSFSLSLNAFWMVGTAISATTSRRHSRRPSRPTPSRSWWKVDDLYVDGRRLILMYHTLNDWLLLCFIVSYSCPKCSNTCKAKQIELNSLTNFTTPTSEKGVISTQ